MTRRRKFLVVLLMGWGVGCSDGQPVPGELDVFLVTPHQIESAAVVELVGVVDQILSAPSGAVFSEVVDGRTRIAVLMRGAGQVWFRVFVPDVKNPPEFRILEVADGTNAIRPDLEGYRLQFEPVRQ